MTGEKRNLVEVPLSDRELAALEALAREKEMTVEGIMRMGLRLFEYVSEDPSRLKPEPLDKAPPWEMGEGCSGCLD
jgi:hypothetical protein